MNNSKKIEFLGSCLKQEDKAAYTPKNVVNLFSAYELDTWSSNLNTDFTLKECLFGAVKLNKNADTNKHKYTNYGIGFDSCSYFSLPGRSMGKNVIIFGVDMSSTLHIDNKEKDILLLGDGLTQGLDGTTFTAEAKYSINLTKSNRKFCLSLYYNESNSFLFVNAIEMYQFKAKDSEIKKISLVFRNISKGFIAINMKKPGLSGYDYNAIDTCNIINIHKYLIKNMI